LNINSKIFERILFIIKEKGIRNVAELADSLGYASPQKIYRLKQEDCKPSYDIIHDFSNKFEDLNIRWFISGEGSPFLSPNYTSTLVSEPPLEYNALSEITALKNRIAELEIEKKSLLMALREIGSGTKEKGE